jgi:hypothetical protein
MHEREMMCAHGGSAPCTNLYNKIIPKSIKTDQKEDFKIEGTKKSKNEKG